MKAFARKTAGGLRRLVGSRGRLWCAFCAVLVVGVGSAVSLAQSGGASGNPFGKPSADVPNPGSNITAVPAARPQGYIDQTRSEVLARNGMAATSQPLATSTAEQILMDGGNAIDAAVGAAATLGVVEPGSTGIGGDMFAIVWSARDKKLYGLSASGWSPKGWTPEYFSSRGLDEVPSRGINSAVVPGTVSGWDAMLKRFGSMGFEQVLEPARVLAKEGFPVHERVASDWAGSAATLREDRDSIRTWLPNGNPPAMYSTFRNPEMARALRTIQRGGRDAFYKGPIARAIVRKSREVGGAIRRDDLAEYPEAEWSTPLSTNYHGYDVHQLPPPGQGFAALEMLNILEVCAPTLGVNLAQMGPRDPKYWHLMIEAKKLAYSDLHRYNADPKFEDVPLDRLLSKEYAGELCDEISMDRARPADVLGNDDGSTVYFATADRWGNMVSFVNSNFSGFGSRVTIPGYGFVLANRGNGFTLEEGHPEPGGSAQAALHHHHRQLHHQGRQAGDGVWEHGRRHAAAGPRAARGQHGRSGHERPGHHGRGTVRPQSGGRRDGTGHVPVRSRRAPADRNGAHDDQSTWSRRRLSGHPVRAGCEPAGSRGCRPTASPAASARSRPGAATAGVTSSRSTASTAPDLTRGRTVTPAAGEPVRPAA